MAKPALVMGACGLRFLNDHCTHGSEKSQVQAPSYDFYVHLLVSYLHFQQSSLFWARSVWVLFTFRRGLQRKPLGLPSPFFPAILLSGNHQKPRANSRFLQRTMVEKTKIMVGIKSWKTVSLPQAHTMGCEDISCCWRRRARAAAQVARQKAGRGGERRGEEGRGGERREEERRGRPVSSFHLLEVFFV